MYQASGCDDPAGGPLPSPSFHQLKHLRPQSDLYKALIVLDLQPVKTYCVLSVHTFLLHIPTVPSAVEKEKQNPSASFMGTMSLMSYWWKAPPKRLIDFLRLLWRPSESLILFRDALGREMKTLMFRSKVCVVFPHKQRCVLFTVNAWDDQTQLLLSKLLSPNQRQGFIFFFFFFAWSQESLQSEAKPQGPSSVLLHCNLHFLSSTSAPNTLKI